MNTKKIRLDQCLVELGLAVNRSQAQKIILAGLVRVSGQVAVKVGQAIDRTAAVKILKPKHSYVSRGGIKLSGALNNFCLDVTNFICLDVGASTGGFTDCLLQCGAAQVTTIDVGYGQLAYKLRIDSRVKVMERINIRYLAKNQFIGLFDLIVSDLSFISLTLILQVLVSRLTLGGLLICLVKPQFESDRKQVGKGGIIYDEVIRQTAVKRVYECLLSLKLIVLGEYLSPITGKTGNLEYFLLAKR